MLNRNIIQSSTLQAPILQVRIKVTLIEDAAGDLNCYKIDRTVQLFTVLGSRLCSGPEWANNLLLT